MSVFNSVLSLAEYTLSSSTLKSVESYFRTLPITSNFFRLIPLIYYSLKFSGKILTLDLRKYKVYNRIVIFILLLEQVELGFSYFYKCPKTKGSTIVICTRLNESVELKNCKKPYINFHTLCLSSFVNLE